MVNEVEKLDRKQTSIFHLALFAASGGEQGKMDCLRSCIREGMLAFQPDSPAAQGRWGLVKQSNYENRSIRGTGVMTERLTLYTTRDSGAFLDTL